MSFVSASSILNSAEREQRATSYSPDDVTGGSRAVLVEAAPLIHTGQVCPLDAQGKLVGGQASEQATRGIENLQTVLQASGSSLAHAVKLNVYVASADVGAEVRRQLAKHLVGETKPAISYVQTTLPQRQMLVAIDAVALPQSTAQAKGGHPSAKALRLPASPLVPWSASAAAVLPRGSRVYISGQAEAGDGSLSDATRKTLEGLVRSLKFVGLDRSHVVQLKAFMKPMSNAKDVEDEVRKFFPDSIAPPLVLVEWSNKLPIEIELIASSPATSDSAPGIEYLTPPELKASPIFSRIARVTSPRTIYVGGLFVGKSGQAGDEETAALFPLLSQTLQAAGSDLRHMAKATYYVADTEVSAALNKIRPNHYDPQRPPAASKAEIVGTGLAGHRITIDMIAVPAK